MFCDHLDYQQQCQQQMELFKKKKKKKKNHGSGHRPSTLALHPSDLASHATALIISNEEIIDIMKIVKSLEESGLLIKGISETIKNEAKEQKGGFLLMLLGTLPASLLGNALKGRGVIRADEGLIMPPHSFN